MIRPLNYFWFLIFFFPILILSCNSEHKDSKKKNNHSSSIKKLPNQLTSEEIGGGWELLFDGKKIDQWRNYNADTLPNQHWSIDIENNLVVEKGGGDLITKRQFENFDLKIEFLLSELANSGIFYRVLEKRDTAIWSHAIEYQLIDSKVLENIKDIPRKRHETGDVYGLYSSNFENNIAIGKWNRARIIILNNYVEHWLNGKLILEYQLETKEWKYLVKKSKFRNYPNFGKTTLGHIGLQEHGSLIKFRNLKIKEL